MVLESRTALLPAQVMVQDVPTWLWSWAVAALAMALARSKEWFCCSELLPKADTNWNGVAVVVEEGDDGACCCCCCCCWCWCCCCCFSLSKESRAAAVTEFGRVRPLCGEKRLKNCRGSRLEMSSQWRDVDRDAFEGDDSQLDVSEQGVDGGDDFFMLRSTTPCTSFSSSTIRVKWLLLKSGVGLTRLRWCVVRSTGSVCKLAVGLESILRLFFIFELFFSIWGNVFVNITCSTLWKQQLNVINCSRFLSVKQWNNLLKVITTNKFFCRKNSSEFV